MRFKSLFYPLFFISVCLTSCEFKCSIGNSTASEKGKKYKPVQKDGMLLYNGIQLKTNNVKINKAYLVHRDSIGEMVDEDNFIDIRKGVKLLLLIDSGWKETGNGVSLGGSMSAVADNGQKLLDMEDIFKGEQWFNPEDSKILGVALYFTEWETRKPVTIDVSFRIWDKNSDAYIQGSYIVHTK